MIRIANVESKYCYRYLSCKERLVVTPLADICNVTLVQAIGLKLGSLKLNRKNRNCKGFWKDSWKI
jgi:hypothetical protein